MGSRFSRHAQMTTKTLTTTAGVVNHLYRTANNNNNTKFGLKSLLLHNHDFHSHFLKCFSQVEEEENNCQVTDTRNSHVNMKLNELLLVLKKKMSFNCSLVYLWR